MKTFYTHNGITALCFFIAVFAFTYKMDAANRTASVSGNWNATATWGGFSVPGAGDVVNINNGITVTVNITTATVASITINAVSTGNNGITISGANTLNVAGAITMNAPTGNNHSSTIAVGSGTLNTGSITIPGSGTNNRNCIVSLFNGTINVNGNINFSGTTATQAQLTFTGAGILNVGGNITGPGTLNLSTGSLNISGNFTMTGTTTLTLGNVNCNGLAQTISPYTFNNLTISGSNSKTFATTPTINGILSLEGTASIIITSGGVTYGTNATLQYNTATARTAGVEWTTPFTANGGVIIANTGIITMNSAETISSKLTINSGSTLAMSTFLLTLNGNLINNGGTTSGSVGVTISGTAATQNIGSFTTTGQVSMTKTVGTATFTGNVNAGALTINGTGGTLNLGAGLTHTFTGIVTLTAGTLNGGSSILNENAISNNAWTGTGSIFTPGTGTVIFGANGNQAISATGTLTFYNVIFNNNGTTELLSNTINCNSVIVNQNNSNNVQLSFNVGTNLVVTNAVTIGTGNYVGRLVMSNGGIVECNNISLGNIGPYITAGTGTIILNGANSTLSLPILYNLTIKNGTTRLASDISIFGTLNIGLPSTAVGVLDVSTSNFSLTLYGNFNDNNTTNNGFVERNGTVNFKGSSDQYVTSNGTFFSIDINKTLGTVYFSNTAFTIGGDLSVTSGTMLLQAATSLSIGGNLDITGTLDLPTTLSLDAFTQHITGTFIMNANSVLNLRSDYLFFIWGFGSFPNANTTQLDPTSTVNYCNTGDQSIRANIRYGNLVLSGSGTKTLVTGPISVAGNITVIGTTFDATSWGTTINLNGSTSQTLTGVTFYDAVIQNTATSNSIVLNSNTTITHSITFTDGMVNALSYPLLFQATATTTGASDVSHVMGIVKKTTNANGVFVFPIGNGIYYRPMGISNSSADTWTASYDRSAYSNTNSLKLETPQINHVSIIEYWNLSPAVIGSSAKVMLSWNPFSFVKSTTSLVVAHWNSTAWENVGIGGYSTIGNAANGTITANNTWNTFSPFTLGSTENDNSLPIELLEFKANVRER